MKRELFRKFLTENSYDTTTVNNRIANVQNIENHYGDIDEYILSGKANSLLEELTYSKEDEENRIPQRHKVPIEGNIRTGTATLKHAFKLYLALYSSCVDDLDGANLSKDTLDIVLARVQDPIVRMKKRFAFFKQWLIEQNYDESAAISRASNIQRLERYYGNLDEYILSGRARELMDELTYTKEDEKNERPQKHLVTIVGNVYNGTATLKAAFKLYLDFCIARATV